MWSRKELAFTVVLCAVTLAGIAWDDAPTWLRMTAKLILMLALFAPLLPFLALLPWHFVALHRGLMSRSKVPTQLAIEDGVLIIVHGVKTTRIALDAIRSAREACNENWSDSKMLADALTIYGKQSAKVPTNADGYAAT